MADALSEYFKEGERSTSHLKIEDYFNVEFIVERCVISEMDLLICECATQEVIEEKL